ncbi:MAG: lysylphosphatidylglycerol synthase transmembrane domain-containing protein [Gammaproteobacteria bacterium]
MSHGKFIQALIYCTLILFFIWVFHHFETQFRTSFSVLSWSHFLILNFLQVIIIGCGGLPFKTLCLALNINIRFRDWLGLSFAASLLNQALPYRPGLAFRFFYLKAHYQLNGPAFGAVSFIYLILMTLSAIVLGFLACLFSNLPTELEDKLLPALGVFSLAIMILILIKWWSKGQIIRLPGIPECHKIVQHPRYLIWSTFYVIFALLIGSLSFYLIFNEIRVPLPFSQCVFLISLLSISMLVPITPGNLGIAETIIGSLTHLLYGDFTQGFMAVILFRLSQLTVSLTLGGPFLTYFVSNKKVS